MSDEKNDAQAQLAVAAERCPIGLYTHYKTDGVYVVHGHSVDEATLAPLVHYYSVSRGSRWTRTIDVFTEAMQPEIGGVVFPTTRFVRTGDVTDEMLARARGDRGSE
jgi:hypothetical protein